MTQTFDLKNMGFVEMQNDELEVVDGGSLPGVFKFFIGVLSDVVEGVAHGVVSGVKSGWF